MAVPHLIKLALHWSGHGEEGVTTMHFVGAGDYSESQLYDAIGNVDAKYADTGEVSPTVWAVLQGWLDPGQSYDDIAAYQYYAGAGGPASVIAHRPPQTARPGTGSPVGCLQQAFVATLTGAMAGRRRRGRQYWPGHTRAVDSSVQMTQTAIDQLADYAAKAGSIAAEGLSDSLAGDGGSLFPWVVYSPTALSATEITLVQVDSRIDIQRRRAASQLALRAGVADLP